MHELGPGDGGRGQHKEQPDEPPQRKDDWLPEKAELFSSTEPGRIERVNFVYTRHVRVRIRQRGLSARQLEAAITSPDRVVPSFRGRIVAQKAVGSKTLEVIYKRVNDRAVIITAYWLEEGT